MEDETVACGTGRPRSRPCPVRPGGCALGAQRDRTGRADRRNAPRAERRRDPADGLDDQDHDRSDRHRAGRYRPRLHGQTGVHRRRGLLDVSRNRGDPFNPRHPVRPDADERQRRGARHRGGVRRRGSLRRRDEREGGGARPVAHPLRQPERAGRPDPLHDRAGAGEARRLRDGKRDLPRDRVHPHLYERDAHDGQPQQAAAAVRGRGRRQDRLHQEERTLSGLGG